MGLVREYQCGCGYKKELYVGGGMNCNNVNMIERLVPSEVFGRFKAELDAGRVISYSIEQSAVYCSECGSVESAADLSCKIKGGEVLRYTLPCPKCGKECTAAEDPDRLICPKCSSMMTFSDIGHWD